MKILSIVSNSSNLLYSRLFSELQKLDIETLSFNPRTLHSQLFSNDTLVPNDTFFPNSKPPSNFWRRVKCRTFARFIAKQLHEISYDFDLIHAHTLSVDAYIAYELSLLSSKPFCFTIRNCDINTILKFRIDLRRYHSNIFQAASAISAPNYAYMQRIRSSLGDKFFVKISPKMYYTPNSIDESFFEDTYLSSSDIGAASLTLNPLRLIHISDGSPNKNILGLIKALSKYGAKLNYSLTFVGVSSSLIHKYTSHYNLSTVPKIVELASRSEVQQLLSRSDVLVNPSFTETFGLVYVEALSRGVLAICPSNEGLDRMIPFPYLLTCDPADSLSIYSAIASARILKESINPSQAIIKRYIREQFSPRSSSKYYAEFYLKSAQQ